MSLSHTHLPASPSPSAQAPSAKPQPIFRKDYAPPPYLIATVHLNFELGEDVTRVTSKLALTPNYTPNGAAPALTLNGRDDVKLLGLKVAGEQAPARRWAHACLSACPSVCLDSACLPVSLVMHPHTDVQRTHSTQHTTTKRSAPICCAWPRCRQASRCLRAATS